MSLVPPVGGAVDMCSTRERENKRDFNIDFETKSERIRRRRDTEEQGRIQAREHPTRSFTLLNHSPLHTYTAHTSPMLIINM